MLASPSVENYLYGKGELFFKKDGESNFVHLGNAPAFGINVALEKTEHYSSMSGTKEKDLSKVIQKTATSSITLEEFSSSNLNIAFLGDGVSATVQSAGNSDSVTVSVVDDEYIELGKMGVFITKLFHASVTDGPFSVGETVTGGTSSATGEVAFVGSGYLDVINVSGTFETNEAITGGTSLGSASLVAVNEEPDVVVTDSEGTTRYVLGTDYRLSAPAGMLMVMSSGSIDAASVKVSFDYPEKNMQSINALANSSCQGHLRFVGNPDIGPKMIIDVWKASLTISGEVAFIGEDASSFPIEGEFLSDAVNHPSCPIFKVVRFD
jgi:hypothetical protein